MRSGIAFLVVVAFLALLAGPAAAGSNLAECDAITAPGGALTTSVDLTNSTDRPARFKITVQVHGDDENVAGPQGKVRGKKSKRSVTVGAGEQVRHEIQCAVPSGALGPVVVTVTVNGPDGRETYEAGSWAFPDGEMPDPSDPPQDWVEPELMELTGTLVLNEDYFPSPYYGKPDGSGTPDDRPMPDDGWLPPPFESELTLVNADGEWQLLGPEAWTLAVLMWKAEITETTATVSGYPLEQIPVYYGEENGFTRKSGKNGGDPASFGNALLLLEWQADGIEDPRPKLVEFRPVFEGDRSKVVEYKEYIVQTDTEWETMLADAGIVFPDPPAPDDPTWGVWRDFKNGGMDPGGMMPPDWMPPEYYWPWDVDLENETVLGLFLGEYESTGYWVWIDQIVREEDGLHVKYYVTEPDEWTPVIYVLTHPFCIVAIPKTTETVVFEPVDAPTWYYDQPMPGPMAGIR